MGLFEFAENMIKKFQPPSSLTEQEPPVLEQKPQIETPKPAVTEERLETEVQKPEVETDMQAIQAVAEFLGLEDIVDATPKDWLGWVQHNMKRNGDDYAAFAESFRQARPDLPADTVERILTSKIGPDYKSRLEAPDV